MGAEKKQANSKNKQAGSKNKQTDLNNEYEVELTTLCYVEKDNQFLMLKRNKKENDRSKDLYIGLGGHFNTGETPEECMLREVYEESSLMLTNYELRGMVTFNEENHTEYMFLYTADEYVGDVTDDCNEGKLEFVDKDKIIGYLPLWAGDEIFLKQLMESKKYFSLKLFYNGRRLESAFLDGKELELFDELDKDGYPTGFTKERSIAHTIGMYHKTVHIWIIRKTEEGFDVLLQKRSEKKDSYPGCYDISSAGHVTAGDEYESAAIREIEEELGIKMDEDELEYIGDHIGFEDTYYHGKRFFNREFARVYVCNRDIDERGIILQEEEVSDVMWINYELCSLMIEEKKIKHAIPMDEWKMLKNYFISVYGDYIC